MNAPKPLRSYPGFNVLLMGPSGTGKTYSISTLCDTPLEVFYLALEPGVETLIGAFTDPPPRGQGKKLPDNFHWHYLQPKTQGFNQLKTTADMIGKFDLSGLAKMKDIKRSEANQMIDLYTCLNDFFDMKTSSYFGPVDAWGNDRVLVIDSMTTLTKMVMDMVIGTKPVRDMSDWGIAQQAFLSLLHKLTHGCNCHFVLIAHVERETDMILGGIKLFPSANLGKAIVPQINPPFSDVILATREGDKFYWDTASSQADVKTRNLPMQAKLPADFTTIYNSWLNRAIASAGG